MALSQLDDDGNLRLKKAVTETHGDEKRIDMAVRAATLDARPFVRRSYLRRVLPGLVKTRLRIEKKKLNKKGVTEQRQRNEVVPQPFPKSSPAYQRSLLRGAEIVELRYAPKDS